MTKKQAREWNKRTALSGLKGYGLGYGVGLGAGIVGPTLKDVYDAKKKWKKVNTPSFDEYWKLNPQAKQFYDHHKARGNTKSVNRLLKKIKSDSFKKQNFINEIFFTDEGTLAGKGWRKAGAFSYGYHMKTMHRYSRPGKLGLGLGIAGIAYGAVKYKPKKRRRKR